MGSIKSNILRSYGQYITILVMFILVLLTSCPIKNGIKSLIGTAMNTEQGRIADRAIPLVNGFERCSELVEGENVRLSFVKETLLLPDDVLILRSSYPFSIQEHLQLSARRNGRQKIVHTLPIFLQYRTLRI
jgi:hypothetical protein